MTNGFTEINGETYVGAKGMALLVGETEEAVTVELRRQQETTPGRFRIPKHWLRQSKELQARLGTSNLDEFIALRTEERNR